MKPKVPVSCLRCERIGLKGPCPHIRDQVDAQGRAFMVNEAGEREYYEELDVWL